MKTLSEIRSFFVTARNLAKIASPASVDEAIENLVLISDHCKELYQSETSFMERAKCRNMYENIDSVIEIMKMYGYCHEIVVSFFGLNNKGVSFGEISAGRRNTAQMTEIPCINTVAGAKTDDAVFASYSNIQDTSVQPLLPKDVVVELPKHSKKLADPVTVKSAPTPIASISVDDPASINPVPVDLSGSDAAELPTIDQVLEPQSLDDYIGQEHIVKRIKEEIQAAKILDKKHLDNIMLFGNKGLGKSTLIELIAKEMGVELEFIDCTTFANNSKSEENFHSFFLNIIKKQRPVVIAFDEIHALTPRLQSRLLTLLQKRAYAYMTDGVTNIVPISDFTFIGATTDYDAVLSTIKDRCNNLTFMMKDYTRSELCKIVNNKFLAMGLIANEEVITLCVNRFRNSLRDIKAIVMGIHTKCVIVGTTTVTVDMVESYFKERGIDAIGLEEKEIEILNVIRNEDRGNLSADTLAARVYLDVKILTKVYEPYLMKIGFVSINAKGRSLTPKALDYLDYGYYDYGDGICVGTLPACRKDQASDTTDAEGVSADSTTAG